MNKKLKKFLMMMVIFAICSILSSNVFATQLEVPDNSTLFHIKKEIKEKYDEANIKIQGTEGPEVVTTTPTIGDYVIYTPDTAEIYLVQSQYSGYTSDQSVPQDTGLRWKILSMNSDGTIDLVADRPINTTVYFQGALGYNNGVYLLNDLCKAQYSNSTLGSVARSIDLEDIEKYFSDEGKAARNDFTYDGTKYGETKTYGSRYAYPPDIYKNHDENVTVSPNNIAQLESEDYYSTPTTATYTKESSLTITQTCYCIISQDSYYDIPNFHNLIFDTGKKYWLASRYANCYSTDAGFGLRYVNSNSISGNNLFNSNYSVCGDSYFVRPVVTLASIGKLQPVSGTTEWEIVYNKIILGDVNEDGVIDTEDSVMILKYLAGNITLSDSQRLAADTSKDGNIDTEDAVRILKKLAGNITEI